MNLEDLLASDDVRVGHDNLAIEPAGPQQSRVEHIRPVGGGGQDDPLVGLEAVHLNEQLIEGLLSLVVAAAEAGAAMPADRVDLVDEDDAGSVLFPLLEHVAHAAGANSDEHLDEVGPGNREERHVCFTGDGAGEQGLAGPRGADQQYPFGDLAAEPLKLLRVLQVFDDLLELLLGFVDPGDILEGDAPDLLGQKPCPALAKPHGSAAAALHLPHEENPYADQQKHREPRDQHAEQRRYILIYGRGGDAHAFFDQPVDHAGVARSIGRECPAVGEVAAYVVALNRNVGNLAAIDVVDEIRKRERSLRSPAR